MINTYVIWFVIGLGLVVAELFTGTFLLLMVAIGFIAGGVVSLMGGDLVLQLVIGAAIGLAGTLILRRSRWGRRNAHKEASTNPDMVLDIGQEVHVSAWQKGAARVSYRGASWNAVPADAGQGGAPGQYKIVAIRGSTLVLAPSQQGV